MIALLALSLLSSLTAPEKPAPVATNAGQPEAHVQLASAEIATCIKAIKRRKFDVSKLTAENWVAWTDSAPPMAAAPPKTSRTAYRRDGSSDYLIVTEGPGQLSCQVFSTALADNAIQSRVIQSLNGVVRPQADGAIVVSTREPGIDVIFINRHGGQFGLALALRVPGR